MEMTETLEEVIQILIDGIRVEDLLIWCDNRQKGRVKEEENFNLFIGRDKTTVYDQILSLKVFYGRKPYYLPWVELYLIKSPITIKNKSTPFFGSIFEEQLLQLFANCKNLLRIFIDYRNDRETLQELYTGVPIILTRMGFLLYQLGFTWFKDWYFAEGMKEGGIKLQAEKAISDDQRERHKKILQQEIQAYISRSLNEKTQFYQQIKNRLLYLENNIEIIIT